MLTKFGSDTQFRNWGGENRLLDYFANHAELTEQTRNPIAEYFATDSSSFEQADCGAFGSRGPARVPGAQTPGLGLTQK